MFSDTSINFKVNNAEQFKESISEPSPRKHPSNLLMINIDTSRQNLCQVII